MAIDNQLIEDLRRNIGIRSHRKLGTIDSLLIKRYAVTIGDDNPLYRDIKEAEKQGFSNIVAPPNLIPSIVEWNEGLPESQLRADGTPLGEHLPGVPSTGVRVMGGGEDIEFYNLAIAGDDIYCDSWLEEVDVKQGKNGPIVILCFRNEYKNQRAELLLISRRTILIR